MDGHSGDITDSRKIGAYLGCSADVLASALVHQQQLASPGRHKRLGEIRWKCAP